MTEKKEARFDAPEYARIKAEKERTVAQRTVIVHRGPAERLSRAFGVFGLLLYYALFLMIVYAPLMLLGFPWWADILIVLGVTFIPYAGSLAEFVLWIWGLLIAVKLPLSLTVVLFYIGAVLYVLFVLIPALLSCFGID